MRTKYTVEYTNENHYTQGCKSKLLGGWRSNIVGGGGEMYTPSPQYLTFIPPIILILAKKRSSKKFLEEMNRKNGFFYSQTRSLRIIPPPNIKKFTKIC